MQLFGVRTKLIKPGDNLVKIILDAVKGQGLTIEDGDILAVASKAVATVQGRMVKLSSIEPSEGAEALARRCNMEPRHVELVLKEAEEIYGGVSGSLLTLKGKVLIPNAGIDHKNVPEGYVILWPERPHETAEKIRREILERTGKRVGVLVVDSRVTPLRMGTVGVAIGIAGFEPIRDFRTKKDLYGNPMLITRHAVADDVASAAHLVMGEAGERMPIVLVKNAPADFNEKVDTGSTVISARECLFMNTLTPKFRRKSMSCHPCSG